MQFISNFVNNFIDYVVILFGVRMRAKFSEKWHIRFDLESNEKYYPFLNYIFMNSPNFLFWNIFREEKFFEFGNQHSAEVFHDPKLSK